MYVPVYLHNLCINMLIIDMKLYFINMKILFIGHSWISYLENNFNKDRHNPNNNDIKFKRIRLSRI
ncbi:hypothetical protein Avbf_15086 [Armadillidium vulgare]|nr:hypothetical protein Avbf_15086 [Armadillidium vulgare]